MFQVRSWCKLDGESLLHGQHQGTGWVFQPWLSWCRPCRWRSRSEWRFAPRGTGSSWPNCHLSDQKQTGTKPEKQDTIKEIGTDCISWQLWAQHERCTRQHSSVYVGRNKLFPGFNSASVLILIIFVRSSTSGLSGRHTGNSWDHSLTCNFGIFRKTPKLYILRNKQLQIKYV